MTRRSTAGLSEKLAESHRPHTDIHVMEQSADGVQGTTMSWNWQISRIHGIITFIEPMMLIIIFVLHKSVLRCFPFIGEVLRHSGIVLFRIGIVNLWRGRTFI